LETDDERRDHETLENSGFQMNRYRLVRPDGSEVWRNTHDPSLGYLHGLIAAEGNGLNGWFSVYRAFESHCEDEASDEFFVVGEKVMLWKVGYGAGTTYCRPKNSAQWVARTKEEAERRVKLEAFE